MDALQGNTTLQRLSLSHNDIAAAEAVVIAQGVAANATLRTLNVSANPVCMRMHTFPEFLATGRSVITPTAAFFILQWEL